MNKGKEMRLSPLGDIPRDWCYTTISDALSPGSKVTYGVVQPGGEDINGVKFVRGGDIKSGKISNNLRTISHTVSESYSRTLLKGGEVLISLVGYPGQSAVVPKELAGANIARQVALLSLSDDFEPYFVHYFLSSELGQKLLLSNLNGSAQQVINLKDLAKVLIPKVLLKEQQKIAEILSTVDKKIDLIDQKIAEAEKLKIGLMQKLFSEGVGVQDENGNWQPHTEFQKTPIGYLPEQWSIKSLEDVCKVKGGKRLPKGETLISEKNEHPYIRVSDMFMGGVAMNDIQYVPEHVVEKIKNYTIGKNDLFISVAGTLGIVGKVPEQLDGANLTENADKLTDIKCNIDYMYYYLCSEKIQSTIDKLKTVGAQPKLALTRIKQFTFIEPSPKEQQKIATILSSVDQKLELLRTQKAETQQLKKGLMQKLLTGEWRVPVEETEAA